MNEVVSIKLGYMSLEEIHDLDRVQHWVHARAVTKNIDLGVYEIHIDQKNGCVTAKTKMPRAVKATIKYDN